MKSIPEVNFEEISGRDGNIGLITLTRPSVLNALNHAMFLAMNEQLTEWEGAKHIKAVVIRAVEGRAFCAGGDIRSAYELKKRNDVTLRDFFQDEYCLNRHIHHYTKPYIALLDGITMGGGAGISIHASHRVATERLVFAMPETGIGFYPDVGMTYYLARLPFQAGIYLGLSGARISHHDCYALGLVDHIVPSNCFPELIYALADATFEDDANTIVTEVLEKFAVFANEGELNFHRDAIVECFSKRSVEEIFEVLEKSGDTWCYEVAMHLKSKSPTSLKVTLHALQKAATYDFDECMKMESFMTNRFIDGHDFFEGIRAVVIDKDQKPQWQPSQLEEVNEKVVQNYFDFSDVPAV